MENIKKYIHFLLEDKIDNFEVIQNGTNYEIIYYLDYKNNTKNYLFRFSTDTFYETEIQSILKDLPKNFYKVKIKHLNVPINISFYK